MAWSPRKPQRSRSSLDARRPARRSEDLIEEAVGDELLVYDRIYHRAHCLSPTAAAVWQACDGRSDPAAISAAVGVPLELVREALDELEASKLLDQGLGVVNVDSDNANGKSVTRREFAVHTAKVGTAAASVPLIVSLAAPMPAAAASPAFNSCGVYTAGSCGVGDVCNELEGCCCCCNFFGGSCKTCTPFGMCPTTGSCPNPFIPGPGSRANCNQPLPPNQSIVPGPQGCCGVAGVTLNSQPCTGVGGCGCLYAARGVPCTGGPFNPAAPTTTGGSGCCDTSGGGTGPFPSCNPASSSTCVPCCNGFPINLATALPGCCVPGPANTC